MKYGIPEEYYKDEFGETEYDRMVSALDTWIGKFLERIDVQNVKMLDSNLWELEKGTKLEINKPPKLFDIENIAISQILQVFKFLTSPINSKSNKNKRVLFVKCSIRCMSCIFVMGCFILKL